MFFLVGLLSACPALRYLLMVQENTTYTRKSFAEAYKCFMKTTSVMLATLSYATALVGVLFAELSGEGWWFLAGFSIFLVSWLLILFTFNFSRVV